MSVSQGELERVMRCGYAAHCKVGALDGALARESDGDALD